MDLRKIDKNKWQYTDAQHNKYDLSIDMRRTQDATFSLHCNIQSQIVHKNKKPLYIQLSMRALPEYSLECVSSRPQTRRWSNKKLLVSNITERYTCDFMFYEQVNPQTNPVHDMFCEFGYPTSDNYEESTEEPLMFEFLFTVCCERSWWQAVKGEDNLFLFEPVHVQIDSKKNRRPV